MKKSYICEVFFYVFGEEVLMEFLKEIVVLVVVVGDFVLLEFKKVEFLCLYV